MDKSEEISFSTDEMSASFSFSSVGTLTSQTYRGSFVVKSLLQPEEFLAAGRERRRLLGEHIAFASEREANMAFALSELKFRIISAPPFWNNGKIMDENIILEVLDKALEIEVKFRDNAEKRTTGAIEKLQKHLGLITEKVSEQKKKEKIDSGELLEEESE